MAATSSFRPSPTLLLLLIASYCFALSSPASAGRKPPQGPSEFTFYIHNKIYNPAVNNSDFTAAYSAGPFNFSQPNPYNFGVRATFEAPITSGPDKSTSETIGTAQGFWILDSQEYFVLLHAFTATITKGGYNGTIAIFGQEDERIDTRILSVVGGTGDFLAARGSATSKLVSINHTAPAYWTLSFQLDLYY